MSRRAKGLRAIISAAADAYRSFPDPRASFVITVQKSLNKLLVIRKALGSSQSSELHIPFGICRQLRSYQPDFILFVQLGIRIALTILYRRWLPGVNLISWETLSHHTEQKHSWVRRAARRTIGDHVNGAFVNGRSGEEDLCPMGYAGSTFTVPYRIDPVLLQHYGHNPSENETRIVYAGKVVPQRGLQTFCAALNAWCEAHPERRIFFSLAGNGPEDAAIGLFATAENLKPGIFPREPQKVLVLTGGFA